MLSPSSALIRGVSLSLLGLSAPLAMTPTKAVVTNNACAQLYKCCHIPLPIYCDNMPNNTKYEGTGPCPKY